MMLIVNSCAITGPQSVIKGKKLSSTGKTTNPNIRIILREGLNPDTIEGKIIAQKKFINLGITLAAWDANHNLICSWSIRPERSKANDTELTYYFIISSKLIKGAELDIFAVDQMHRLNLSTVRILPKKQG
ncbi:hypothetical protein NT6N_24410 [Oceaniferula spumae]|uniref:Uncharacterized protein n=1 Tax=Oceaniferula spumae TaxID=2979115 RepID=A0AAT9FN33_9BACT